ncbi:gastrula zinc finger protein XlCGF53.1-like [Hyperolius riggenbachi]|uniref:gastrula zinc finger protein XlCGF53.1-like n=1 Tax=Hyperolius riggenbachi TaxID=752182 RepID=UPI0035A30F0E
MPQTGHDVTAKGEVAGRGEETLLEEQKAAASCTDHMPTSLRMDEDQSHMTERIFNLTLEIIYLLTGESYSPMKFGDHVTITEPRPHSLTCEGHKEKILEVTRKMIELLTGEVPLRCQDVTVYFSMEEWQYIEGHKDLYKDIIKENQPLLTPPDVSSNKTPPERCTGPLFSQDCPQKDHTISHPYQGGELMLSAVAKEEEVEMYMRSDQQSMEEGDTMRTSKEEEEETYVSSDQQSMEEGDIIRTNKEKEEEMYVWNDQQSMEEGDTMRTSKEEEEETYVSSDQQSMEEGDMMRTSKEEEEETYVRSDQQSMEEGDKMRTSKEEEEETYVRSDQQSMEEGGMVRTSQEEDTVTESRTARSPGIRNLSETHLSVSTDCKMDDDGIGQETPADILVTPNIPPDSPHLSNPEGPHTQHSSPPAGGSHSCSTCGKSFVWNSELVMHERSHTGEKPHSCAECGKCFRSTSHLVRHKRTHTGEKPFLCTECGKCYGDKAYFVRHVRFHTGEKPYSCTECGKCFGQRAGLVRHKRTHTGEKPFLCTECGKCFGDKTNLIRHVRFHTGEKPSSCAEYGK